MDRMQRALIAAIAVVVAAGSSSIAGEPIALWPGTPPGDAPASAEEKDITRPTDG